MTRLVVFAAALTFVVGFAFLTIEAIAQQGLSVAGALALLLIVILTVGIVGALRHPPRG
jgi:hypothetical protein